MSSSFSGILAELQAMHDKKSADYGKDADPLANLRACEKMALPAWIGVMVRLGDKRARIESFITKGRLENESLEDSLIDQCVYSILALLLYREGVDRK